MKRILALFLLAVLLTGCTAPGPNAQIAATTLPVYEFTQALCQGTGLTVTRLVTENVSCLHDYSLSVLQVKAMEAAETVVISGAGLEDALGIPLGTNVIDCASGVPLLECHEEGHEGHEGHHHAEDPHIWLSPENAKIMVTTLCQELSLRYPQHEGTFAKNRDTLLSRLDALLAYGKAELSVLSSRELITFHDGFAYFAEAFDLTVLEAVEEESGSEASAAELKHLITLVREHSLPAVFVERSGSVSAAGVIAAETGAKVFTLDMVMAGDSYFDAMYHNIDTVKEALG